MWCIISTAAGRYYFLISGVNIYGKSKEAMSMATKDGKKPYSGPKRLIIVEDGDLIDTILCREDSGKLIECRRFTDHTELKKYRRRLKAGSENVETLKLIDPWFGAWDMRYNLVEWENDPNLVWHVPELLSRFVALCDDDHHCPKAQAPLLLLGAFLSAYTSEPFCDIDRMRNEAKNVIGVWEGSTNPDGTHSWRLSHTTVD